MSTKKITVVTCDMCGANIDLDDEDVTRNSVLGEYMYVIVHYHNPSYDRRYQIGITGEHLDLCPACADRAAAIHMEVEPTDDRRSCHHKYSWREGE